MGSSSLDDAAAELALAWHAVYDDYRREHPGRDLILTCTYRSPEEQASLYAHGRTAPGPRVTNTLHSKHNLRPARAIDFAVLIHGKISWDWHEYVPVGELGERHGLVWGGHWKTLHDFPHLEL